ncbi:MAG: class I SAM-dependent methyltransferase [Acidobacteria bacterium]|nr:class I SAM-dependent methyltransferase [Acidobacteriota bacterium]MCA1649160.1 class I SAM-dependent methyltransferase [Acidobacteriota bacterium]
MFANPRAPEDAVLARYSSEYFWKEYLPAAGAPEGRIDLEWLDTKNRPMLDLIRRHAPSGLRLLEVGTGAGLFLKAAERAGWSVSGLELSGEGATFARDRLGLEVRQERAEAMTFAPRSFDVAVMFDVIEHLFDPGAVLGATHSALRPGGLIVISTPNFDALSRHALGADWAVLSPLEHLYYFTEGTLAAILQRAGFQRIQFVRQFAGWGVPQTMNHAYTHSPGGRRARLYEKAVQHLGEAAHSLVLRFGRADSLLAVACSN